MKPIASSKFLPILKFCQQPRNNKTAIKRFVVPISMVGVSRDITQICKYVGCDTHYTCSVEV